MGSKARSTEQSRMILHIKRSCFQTAFESVRSSEEKLSVATRGGQQISVNRALICFFSPVIRSVVKDVPKDVGETSIILPDFQVAAIEHLLNILNSGVACFAVLKDVVEVANALGISLENIEHTDERHVEKIAVGEKLDYDLELTIKEEVSEIVSRTPTKVKLEEQPAESKNIEKEKNKVRAKVPPIPALKQEIIEVSQDISVPEELSTIPIEPLPVVVTDFLRAFRKTPRPLVPTLVVPELSESYLRNHLPHSLGRLVITLEEKQEVYCLYEGLRHVEGKEERVAHVPDIFFPSSIKDQLKMKRRLAFLTGKWFRWGITHYGASSPPGGHVSPDTRARKPRSHTRHTKPVARAGTRATRHRTLSGQKTMSDPSKARYSSSRARVPDTSRAKVSEHGGSRTCVTASSSTRVPASSRTAAPGQRREEEPRRRRAYSRSRDASPSRTGRDRSRRTRSRSRSRLR